MCSGVSAPGRRRAAVLEGPLHLDRTGSLLRAQMTADGALQPIADDAVNG